MLVKHPLSGELGGELRVRSVVTFPRHNLLSPRRRGRSGTTTRRGWGPSPKPNSPGDEQGARTRNGYRLSVGSTYQLSSRRAA